MPIHKRDRSFENIVREVEIDKIPVEYIQTLTLVLESGDRVIFQGEDMSQIDEDNIVNFIMTVVDELGEEYDSPVRDLEFVINYSRLEQEISLMTSKLLNKEKNDDQGDIST